MLREFKNVSQQDRSYRRLFSDDYFDLFLWYTKRGSELIGFQLCYNKKYKEHSLIWKNVQGYLHSAVDSGENTPGGAKRSPILVADGVFDNVGMANRFKEHSDYLDTDIAELVYDKLLEYDKSKENPFL
ncbi:MAG: hypothetical protein PF518_02895 [Spirochaetaceae bacterium]|jgi:hypothetical protein|nr:hypothetical protein [Spirochaetaceae bacterium]